MEAEDVIGERAVNSGATKDHHFGASSGARYWNSRGLNSIATATATASA